ncbi:MAG: DUF448 domain-containing protein [Microbacteriaceae bacterium]|nr:DUF448 domain-containing protein [Microbacteriaceae bacterium]
MNPVRTCLGCRQRATASSLLRVVVAHGKVVVDHTSSLPGRGAWVHSATDCLDKALSRKTFGRALRFPAVIVDAEYLRAEVVTKPLGRLQ